jgi:citrate lyase beta subunit
MALPDAAMARSLLFVPASRPDRYAKALSSGADIVCVDLEDAVAPGAKVGARADALGFLAAADADAGPARALRINALTTATGLADLLAVAAARPGGGFLMLPKLGAAAEAALAAAILDEAGVGLPLIPLVETLDGLELVDAIARATPRMAAIMLGAVDLATELGVALEPEPLAYARSRVVHACRRAGIGAIDGPTLDVRDPAVAGADAQRARRLGFTGKAVIHPVQVAPIHAAFTPTADEVARAERVLAAFAAAEGGVARLDGALVEKPVAAAAARVLARARAR